MSQAISAGITAANQYNQTGREAKGDSLGKSDFLLLLVTQFKYQDPLNPMDDKEFVAQLSQFSSLEQLMNLNTSMDSLTDATRDQQLMSASNYIGKDVAASGNSVAKKDGHVGKMYWAVDGDMAKGAIYVFDAEKNQVYAENLPPTAGYTTNTFEWSGRNYMGALVPDGVYYITISAEDANGQTLLVDYRVTGRVEGVATEGGETYLRLDDGRVVALKNVKEIAAAKAVEEDPDPTPPDPDPPSDPDTGP
jgi:flagellar basal-body rod modification protein FlgD